MFMIHVCLMKMLSKRDIQAFISALTTVESATFAMDILHFANTDNLLSALAVILCVSNDLTTG